ncbi:hypothetical protein DDE18_00395 [Nocardioides gansuensis]|uniref:Secreted protein n=1 Tax=Nocardioides gansuensis TaxID=2138300 RepID=A0A2T8FEM1_9ACTN|nr:hypothetical protein DDE18_00395 [Nocardioides gansuensis]
MVAVLAGLVVVLSLGLARAPAHAAPRAEDDPLVVRIDALLPSTLQPGEPVVVGGTVTNASDETWTDVNLHAFRSTTPITDTGSLAASAAIDPLEYVGERVITPSTWTTVDVLEPGQSAPFTLSIPWEELTIDAAAPGVYWFGVHALGAVDGVRPEYAVGRARTFLPLVAETDSQVEAAFVVPVRGTVWHEPDGQIARVPQWTRSLSEGGRLESLLDVADAAGASRLSWLVDPAVLVAVDRLAKGNPPRSLAPDPAKLPAEGAEGDGEAEPDGGETGAGQEGESPSPFVSEEPDHETTDEQAAAQAAATAWLERFRTAMAGQDVLALPYGDIDASAALAHDRELFDRSVTRSRVVMEATGVFATPALAPRDGILSAAAVEAAAPESTVLLGDTAFAVPPASPTSMVRMLGHKVIVTSTAAAAGGPAPAPDGDPIAVRQRLLSEASLRLAAGDTAPVVVMLPADWHPRDPADLFGPLELPWLRAVGINEVVDRPAVSATARDLVYTEEDLQGELDRPAFAAAREMIAAASQLEKVLTAVTTVEAQVADEALTTLSSAHRERPGRGVAAAEATTRYLRGQLASIEVEAPSKVTLSSQTGRFGATLVNGLDQIVTVRVAAESEDEVSLEDLGPITLAPASRTRIRPDITTDRLGIHDVRLVVTDVDGRPLGGSDVLPVRAAQASRIIWVVMGLGAAILVGAMALRLRRRLVAAREATA